MNINKSKSNFNKNYRFFYKFLNGGNNIINPKKNGNMNKGCLKLMKLIEGKIIRAFYNLVLITKFKNITNESELAQNLLQENINALDKVYNCIKAKVTKKVNFLYNTDSLNIIKVCIIIRYILNKMGYENVHDTEILSIVKENTYDALRPEEIIKGILKIIRYGRRVKENYKEKRIQYATAYIKTEFVAYDYKFMGKLESEAVILLYQKFCVQTEDEFPLKVYKDFEFCVSNTNRIWSKDETIKFIVDHMQTVTNSLPKLKVPPTAQSMELSKNYDPRVSYDIPKTELKPIREDDEEFSIIQDRLMNIESKIDMLNNSKTSAKNLVRGSSDMGASMRSFIDPENKHKKHTCKSRYCLLCRNSNN